MDGADRVRDRMVTLGGVIGQNLEIPSANPVNYHQAVNDPDGCEPLLADGKLSLPPADGPLPLVMVVPGSARRFEQDQRDLPIGRLLVAGVVGVTARHDRPE